MVSPEPSWNIAWYTDPIFFGHYPEEGLLAFGKMSLLLLTLI